MVEMINLKNFVIQFLPTAGFILALILLAHILRERRSPTSTMAWLLAIIFIPYIAVPFYLIFGGRKMKNKAAHKPFLEGLLHSRALPQSGHLAAPSSREGLSSATWANQISLFPDGERAYQATLDLIKSARQSICVATFILGHDDTGKTILTALTAKAVEGVRVFLLLDALGSVKIKKRSLTPLIKAGGHAAFFMPSASSTPNSRIRSTTDISMVLVIPNSRAHRIIATNR